MKKHLFALLFLFSLAYTSAANAQSKPKIKTRHAFTHNSEAGQGKTNKAHFRKENGHHTPIDLTPHKLETFRTAKANKNYKYSKGH